jgi:ribosomal protein S8E
MKKYSDEDYSRTDVNGAWKPLKPITEGFEFIGDEQHDDFLNANGKKRRQIKRDLRQSGLSRKEARKEARNRVPMSPRQRELAHKVFRAGLVTPRGAFIALVRLNYRGFAWKIDAILNGKDANLKTKLQEKWYSLGGEFDKLTEAVNAGKVKKPKVCGKSCKQKLLEVKSNFTDESNYFYPTGVEETIAIIKANASVIIKVLGGIISSAIVASSKSKEIKSAERVAEQENATLSQAEKNKIALAEKKIEAETDPRNQIINDPNLTQEEKESALKLLDESEGKKLNKDVIKYVVIGGIALVAIFLISKTIKKK